MNAPEIYPTDDIRKGRWTTIEESLNGVTVRLQSSYLLGQRAEIAMVTAAAIINVEFIAFAGRAQITSAATGIVSALMVAIAVRRRIGRQKVDDTFNFPLFIADQRDAPIDSDNRRIIYVDEIEKMEVRNNIERMADDEELVQIWLHLRTQIEAVVIHQAFAWKDNRNKMDQVAERLAVRWKLSVENHQAVPIGV